MSNNLPFPRFYDVEVISKSYGRLLWPEGRGYGLYFPHLHRNLHADYLEHGIQLGDVGTITKDGNFRYRFNIFLPADHPFNRNRVPNGFIPMQNSRPEVVTEKFESLFLTGPRAERHIETKPLPSGGERVCYNIQYEQHEGAALIAPEEGITEDLVNVDDIRRYVTEHAAEWYYYRNADVAMTAGNGSLHVVTGYDKTAVWYAVTFTDGDPPAKLQIFSNTSQMESEEKKAYKWSRNGPGNSNDGPIPDENSRLLNQCLFLRTFCIQLQDNEYKYLRRPRLPHWMLALWDFLTWRDSSVIIELLPNPTDVAHPSRLLAKCLLRKMPGTKLAIIHQSDWQPLINKEDALPGMEELEHLIEKYYLIEIAEDTKAVLLKRRN